MDKTPTPLARSLHALLELRESLEDGPAEIPEVIADHLNALENYLLKLQKAQSIDSDAEFVAGLLLNSKNDN